MIQRKPLNSARLTVNVYPRAPCMKDSPGVPGDCSLSPYGIHRPLGGSAPARAARTWCCVELGRRWESTGPHRTSVTTTVLGTCEPSPLPAPACVLSMPHHLHKVISSIAPFLPEIKWWDLTEVLPHWEAPSSSRKAPGDQEIGQKGQSPGLRAQDTPPWRSRCGRSQVISWFYPASGHSAQSTASQCWLYLGVTREL